METETATALVIIGQLTPPQLFAPGTLDPLVERVKAEVRAIKTDISTEEGRKAIASLAYKIARTKTFIDDRRVELVADEKKRLAAIDSEGKRVRDELDALKEEVRKPLTDWENADNERIKANENRIAAMMQICHTIFASLDDIDHASGLLDLAWDHNFQEFIKRAGEAHEGAALHLQSERQRIEKAGAERIEANRLAIEATEMRRIERDRVIAERARLEAEAEAKQRADAKDREAKEHEAEILRMAAEEKTRAERERLKAEEDAKQREADLIAAGKERERKAKQQREADRVKAEADRELAVANERKRQEDIRAGEMMRAQQAECEKKEREADEVHRRDVHNAAVLAMLNIEPFTTYLARQAIDAIAKGLVTGVTINY